MFFHVVRKNSFQGIHLIGFTDLSDHFSDLVVELSGFDEPESSLGGFISSKRDISLLSSNLGFGIRLNDDCMGEESSKTINMGT